MPSPIGHSIISLGVYYLFKYRIVRILLYWKTIVFIFIMGNLPDLDFIPGILTGDPSRYHETYTHTLGFAVIVSFFAWLCLLILRSKNLYKLAFLSFVLIYTHVIFDSFNMDSRPPIGVMMVWPFTDKYFYLRTPFMYPFDRDNLGNFLSMNSLFALFTELAVGIPLLALGIVSTRTRKLRKIIIYGLLFILFVFIFPRLTVYRGISINEVSGIREGLRGRIVFSSNRDGTNQIYVVNADCKSLKQLTCGNGENFSPSWSPDGRHIVFVSTRDGNKEIYVMDKKGKRHKRITFDPSDDTDPVWMPDGKRILFLSNRSSTANFYTVDIDGEELKMITQFTSGEYGHPSVSGEGDKIIYVSNEFIGWQLYSYDIASGHKERLTNPPTGNCDPDISNDGEKILYVSRFGMGNSDIWIMDSNGDNGRELISHPALDYNPKFSPDNKYIVFTSERDGNWNIYIMEIDSRNIMKLTDEKSNNDRPDWGYSV